VTPSTTIAKSPAADTSRPGTALSAGGDGFWMSAGMARLTDLGLVMVVLLFAAPAALGRWPDALLTMAMILPLLWRRRWPTMVFGLVAGVAFAQWLIGGQPLGSDLALLVAFYTVAAYESLKPTMACAGVLELGIVLAAARWSSGRSLLFMIVMLSGMAVAAGVLGLNVRTRRAYLDSLRDRAERLERDRDQQSVIVAAAERARIATEMHDVVAHHLAVMTALADGARFALSAHPDQAATAMDAVSATGRAALSDMHALLGVLADRSGEECSGTSPQPGLDAMAALAAQVSEAGLAVTFRIDGAQEFPVAQGLQLVAYRVVQEALTNALKHGGSGARAQVDVRVAARTVDVEVIDQGGAPTIRPYGQHPTQGRGLMGMRERVAAYDGTLHAGPRPQGGWGVLVLLPRTEDEKK
jgi:signal transduction histidine kinase